MECRDVRDMADAFLAEELLGNTSHQILRHLETCRGCRDDLDARRALRDRVRSAFYHARELAPTPEFRGIPQAGAQHPRSRRHDLVKPFCNRLSKIYESLTKSV